MPKTQTIHVTHRFGGGWAPDYGKLVTTPVPQSRQMEIPYVLEAKNIFWNIDGGYQTIGGATKTPATQLGSGAEVMGLYDYWRIGTTGSYTRRKICHVGTLVMQDGGNDTWVNLKTGMEDGKHPNYSTFSDLLIFASDGNTDVPQSWDQTTQQALAGSPPNFAFSLEHKGRLWAAGAVANPSRLYYSGKDNPEQWPPTAGAGYIDISPGDGDEIRGLASFKNELWVFKGPNKGSIHRITGSSPSDFARVLFIRGLACVGHSSIIPFKDDILFMTPSGSIRSLKATAAFGDYHDAALTFPINNWLIDNLNHSQLKTAWAVNDPTTSHLYFAVPTGSNATNNIVLCYDYQFASVQKPDRWSRITDWPVHSIANVVVSGLPRVYGGSADGYIRDVNVDNKNVDGTTTLKPEIETPYLNYGSSFEFKTIEKVSFTVSPQGDDVIDFAWERDNEAQQSVQISQGAVDGVMLDTFLLDTDMLAGGVGRINEVYYDLEEGGDFRWIRFKHSNRTFDDNLIVHTFGTGLQFDASGTE